MITHYVIYSPETGEIEQYADCPSAYWFYIQADLLSQGKYTLQVTTEPPPESYVHLTDLAVKPKGDYSLEALPLPCTVTIEGVEYACTAQPDISFERPGVYTLTVDAGAAWLRKTFEVDHADTT